MRQTRHSRFAHLLLKKKRSAALSEFRRSCQTKNFLMVWRHPRLFLQPSPPHPYHLQLRHQPFSSWFCSSSLSLALLSTLSGIPSLFSACLAGCTQFTMTGRQPPTQNSQIPTTCYQPPTICHLPPLHHQPYYHPLSQNSPKKGSLLEKSTSASRAWDSGMMKQFGNS